MSTVKSSSENLTLNADGVGSDVVIQNNGIETVRINDTGVISVTGTLDVTNSAAGDADAIELSNFSGDSSVIKSKRGLVLSADYDNNSGASQSNISFQTDGTEQANITNNGAFQFNSGYGSAITAYGVRAWVNFNGEGTVSIRGSGNVSSITDLGLGQYTVNYTSSIVDRNYAVVTTSCREGSRTEGVSLTTGVPYNYATVLTTSVRLYNITGNYATGGGQDPEILSVAVIR